MKKTVLILCFIFLAIISSFYFLIPGSQLVYYKVTVNAAENSVSRLLLDKKKWVAWWPGKKEGDDNYSYKNSGYRIYNMLINSFEATVFHNKDSIKGILQILPSETDSTELLWTATLNFSSNPLTRLTQYARFSGIKSNVRQLLDAVKIYLDRQENIYGMKIVKEKVTDSSLIAVKQVFRHYPSTGDVYEMVHTLKTYIAKKNGKETNYPMLNIYQDGANHYEAMVAIPTQKDLPSEGQFQLKKMVLGNILMAEVRGGGYTVIKGEQELTNYVHDYKKMSPAIPYQSLVTDRSLEQDTAKWITRLYYPIFY